MAHLADVVARCKGEVIVSVNPERSSYQTREEYLRERGVAGNVEVWAILDAPDLYELQFYPDSPVGFLVVFGLSLDDVVAKALAVFGDADRPNDRK